MQDHGSCMMPITILQILAKILDEVALVDLFVQSHHAHEMSTAIACEVLARRIVHLSPSDRLASIMSTRFRHREADGDESELSSALEVAIDSNW